MGFDRVTLIGLDHLGDRPDDAAHGADPHASFGACNDAVVDRGTVSVHGVLVWLHCAGGVSTRASHIRGGAGPIGFGMGHLSRVVAPDQ